MLGDIKQCCDPSVCPCVCLAPLAQWYILWLWLLQHTNRKPMLEVKTAGQCGCVEVV